MRSPRARTLFWAAVACVVFAALATGWAVFGRLMQRPPADPVQVSVSPDGRWKVETWFVGDDRLGQYEGVLRVDVTDLADPRPVTRTVYATRVEDRDAARRLLLWRDAERLELSLAGGGVLVLDMAHAHPIAVPGESFVQFRAAALATASLLAVLAVGVLSVLLVNSWLLRRAAARWEDWPVDWTEGRRHATRG